ncbi:cytochrome c biogenesis protein ResB [Streptomonospora sp. S1-112]|uniref:Cytochrome c biogenesis protein ResB n=1 Tax=Streptomonospora mangrovi TaxID=2883123 RepID=A0A9X3NN10_9ACTN|nr:cytochrome c biogenesis protein ResB [Streptomonospora mangrovi]MDA0563525.1 cytochrome c biogenesis protein ResB [Streptomonospora mangrovi]
MSALGWARWAWRILTSMRTALILLFLLAVGAIPGSMLPQRGVSVEQVRNYFLEHPDLAPWLDRFYLFDVYSSPWYAAIYLLLFVSLTGCVLPRAAAHYRAMRARPPRTPRNLERMPYSATFTTAAPPERVVEAARALLRRHRIDTAEEPGGARALAAETGYLRETGNVLFHLALLALLIALGAGSFLGYRGNMLVVEGDGFANTLTSYDAFFPGTAVDEGDLQPFSFTVEEFQASFIEEGDLSGQAAAFSADLSYRAAPDAPEQRHHLAVNHPLSVDGAQVYLLGHGYAPEFRVTNAEGDVVFDQPVPFIAREETAFTSDGVIKVPDAGEEQLGFTAVFLPSAAEGSDGELVSTFPDPRNPVVTLTGYQGDLGMDDGRSQSVYQLYTDDMRELGESPELSPGDTWELPDGAGTVTFTGYRDYISMQVNSDPSRVPALAAAATAVLGLLATLFVRPRRAWVRARPSEDGRTVVEVAGLSKTENAALTAEFHRFATSLRDRLRETPATDTGTKE